MKKSIPCSEERKKKLKENAKINPNYGMKGKNHSNVTKKKLSESHKGKVGTFLGKKHTKESRDKMSIVQKGKKKPFRTKEHRENLSKSLKGKKLSEETKKKISNSTKGRKSWNEGTKGIMKAWNKGLKGFNKDYPRNEEWNKKISKGKKNSLRSKLASQKVAKAMGKNNIGKESSRKGTTLSKATKGKISKTKMMNRENYLTWKGGVSFEPYPIYWTDDLKDSIRKRDDYVCQECGIHQDELKRKLDVHHINYDKKNLNQNNLITLCRHCHLKTNWNREYWINYFEKL